jgi:simple sugar transport system substrate-binding protein
MMKKQIFGLAAALAMTMSFSAASVEAKTKACFVYVGSVGDFGWTYEHDHGRKMAEEQLGDAIETAYVENIAEGPDAERAIERCARSGCNIIFTTSFGYMEPTLKVAKKFPDIKFEHATGYKTSENVTSYNAKFHEGRYVIGQIAGKMSKTGIAGYIVSFPIPEVIAGINAFMLGAQSVNPDFKVKVIWVNSWFDPGKEADAAKVLISQGADMLTQHTDSTAAMQIAEEQGKNAFGQASDMIKFGPNAQLTAIIDNWGPYYVRRIKAAMDGTWATASSWDGMAEGTVKMAPFTNMPDDVKAMAEKTTGDITSGALHPFTGPITKQDGTVVGEAGKPLADGDILGMNWYVKGIDDKLPQ